MENVALVHFFWGIVVHLDGKLRAVHASKVADADSPQTNPVGVAIDAAGP